MKMGNGNRWTKEKYQANDEMLVPA